MSILPKCLVEPEISASTSSRREMLQGITWASPPALRMPVATSSQASALRLEITTFAPSFASSSAEDRPMPRLEPVMTATLPVRSNGVDCIARIPFSPGSVQLRCDLDQSAGVGDAAQVIIGIAEHVLDHGEPLEVVADLGLHGHADAAVQLNRLLTDEFSGLADLNLGGADGGRALLRVVEIAGHGGEHRHAARLLQRHEHVGGTVLQRLETADRHAELLAGLEILDRGLERLIHDADRFGADRGARFIDDALDQRQPVLGIADHRIGADLDAGEADVGGMQPVLRRVAFLRHAFGVGRNQEYADAAGVALAALGARGDDQGVGALAVEHDEFLAVDHPAVALFLGRGRDVMQVVARVLLQLRERKGLAALDDARNVRGLLRGGPAMAQEAAGDDHGGEIRLEHQRLAHRLHRARDLDRARTEAALRHGERQRYRALLGQLAPDVFAPAALFRPLFLALVEIVGVAQQALDAFLEKPLLLRQIKIHFLLSSDGFPIAR